MSFTNPELGFIMSQERFINTGILASKIVRMGIITTTEQGWSRIPNEGNFIETITNSTQVSSGSIIIDLRSVKELVKDKPWYDRATAKHIHDFTTKFFAKLGVDTAWKYPTPHPTFPFEVTILAGLYGSVEDMYRNTYGATFVYKPGRKTSILR